MTPAQPGRGAGAGYGASRAGLGSVAFDWDYPARLRMKAEKTALRMTLQPLSSSIGCRPVPVAITTGEHDVASLSPTMVSAPRVEVEDPTDPRPMLARCTRAGGAVTAFTSALGAFGPPRTQSRKSWWWAARSAGPVRSAIFLFLAVEGPADQWPMTSIPCGAVERGAVLVALLDVGRPDPLLEDELLGPARAGRSGYSKTAYWVSGNCWSSSKKDLPPRQAIRPGWVSTPRPQQATSRSWTPSLPMSPQPKSYHQRQMPGSRFER